MVTGSRLLDGEVNALVNNSVARLPYMVYQVEDLQYSHNHAGADRHMGCFVDEDEASC